MTSPSVTVMELPSPTRGLHAAAWWLVLAVGAFVVLPRMFTWGLYGDGNCYALISRNMAAGVGWAWDPFLSPVMHPHFKEHPALFFVCQSLWFRVFGDQPWVEKAYGLFLLLASLPLLTQAWRLTRPAGTDTRSGWMPLCLWVAMPLWPWIWRNGMIECQIIVLALGAAVCLLEARARDGARALPWHAAAGALMAASALTKGPFGLFPLTMPVMFALVGVWPWRRALRDTAGLVIAFAVCFGLAMAVTPIRGQFLGYVDQQLLASLSGKRHGSPGERVRMLVGLASQLAPAAAVAAIALIVVRRRGAQTPWRSLAAWALVGAAGSLPLLVVTRYSTHYLATSLPFYALGLAMPVAVAVESLAGARPWAARRQRWAPIVGLIAIVAAGATSVALAGRVFRDKREHAAIAAIAPVVGGDTGIGADAAFSTNFQLHHHLYREHWIVLDYTATRLGHRFYLAPDAASVPAGFRPRGERLPDGWVLAERAP